jgi:hypothetical protein
MKAFTNIGDKNRGPNYRSFHEAELKISIVKAGYSRKLP